MRLVQLTLYEIFGYVFPGATAMAGVYLLYWTFLLPANQDWRALSSGGWTAILAIAYVFGHFAQSITNLVLKWCDWRPERHVFNQDTVMPVAIRSVLIDRARKAVGVEQREELTAEVVYDIADHAVLQRDRTETRDIYIYREGFYRGMTLGLLLLAIGCFGRMIAGTASLEVFGVGIAITRWTLLWTGCVALVMMYLSFTRYLRFASYRVRYAFYSFLIAWQTTRDEAERHHRVGAMMPESSPAEPPVSSTARAAASPATDVARELQLLTSQVARLEALASQTQLRSQQTDPALRSLRARLRSATRTIKLLGNGGFGLAGFVSVAFLTALYSNQLTLLSGLAAVFGALFLSLLGLHFHSLADRYSEDDL